MPVTSWSASAASNTSVGGISIAENMARSNVNDAIRAVMAEAKAGFLETASVKGYGAVGDGTTDDSAAFTSALLAGRFVYVPPGTYNLASMVTIDALGVGGRTLYLAAGATLTRTTGGATTPIIWVKNDECALIGQGKASQITSTYAHPEGLVIVGHRDLTQAHANVRNCTVADIKLSGRTQYGSTTATDKCLVLISSQVTGLISYFHTIRNVHFEKANVGLEFRGDANGNYCTDLYFQWIGNGTWTTNREAILFNGGLENIVNGFVFHYSPGSTAVRMIDCDNTGNGGIITLPQYNFVRGTTEQDPTPSGGVGLKANAGCTGAYNRIELVDNCPSNDIGNTFARANRIRLISTSHDDQLRQGKGFIAWGDLTLPTDRTSVGLGVDTANQRGRLRAIYEGTDWRRMVYQAREHYYECDGGAIHGATAKGKGYLASTVGTVTQATSKSTGVTLNKHVCDVTLNNAALAADTTVSFTLTNSNIETGDTVIVQHISGGTLGSYTCGAGTGGAGSATVWLRNITGGSLSEAAVLRCTVEKASLAA
jgi:hypothetical protein